MKEKRWSRGHISRFWDNSFKELEYIKQSITQEELDTWTSMGYDHVKSFTGSMFDNRNPMPDWVNNFKILFKGKHSSLPYKNMTYTFYRMDTLEIMPVHSDHYRTYIKMNNANPENIRRILVMLEDWKPGHYLEIDGVGITSWIAGDYFIWENNVPHAASNIGVEPRYTLQITCEEITSADVWQNLHWFNIPELESKIESEDPTIVKILHSMSDMTKPIFLYMYNERIKDLENLKHSPEVVNHLNDIGVHVYLYEPLCSYKAGAQQLWEPFGTKHNRLFYSEFASANLNPDNLRADELDSILLYVQNNNLTNVIVHTCDYDVDKFYPYYKPHMKLLTDDLFVKNTEFYFPKDETPKHLFKNKFICANWRYAPHRHFITAYLAPMESHVSWYFRGDLKNIARQPWTDIFHWDKDSKYFNKILKGLEYLNKNAPLNLDLTITEPVDITHPYFIQTMPAGIMYDQQTNLKTLEECYKDAFVSIVNESRYAQPTGNYSEKVYQPMFYKRPFILGAPPKTLQFLKEEGFKTFSDFWDESYDDCYDHEKRLFKIFDLIDKINETPIDQLQEMYIEMIPILRHNRNLVETKIMRLDPKLWNR